MTASASSGDSPTAVQVAAVPVGLNERGKRLWAAVVADFDLRADELIVLEEACAEADLIAVLKAEMIGAELVVRGSMGQPAANPIVTELRQHRTTLRQLLAQLRLTSEAEVDDPAAARARSENARTAARARWTR